MLKEVIIVSLVLLVSLGGSSQNTNSTIKSFVNATRTRPVAVIPTTKISSNKTKTTIKNHVNVTRVPAVTVTSVPKSASQTAKYTKKPIANVTQPHVAGRIISPGDCEYCWRYTEIGELLIGINNMLYGRHRDLPVRALNKHFTFTFRNGTQLDKEEICEYVYNVPPEQNINIALKLIESHTDDSIGFSARIYGPGHHRLDAYFLYSLSKFKLMKGYQ